jgi:hypothetical protein
MVESMAERNAKVDFDGSLQGWTPEFSEWYRKHREVYLKEARDQLNEEATNDEIDEEIENELEAGMTDIATFTNEQLIAVCRADVAEMSKFLKRVNSAIRPRSYVFAYY